jgi:hypothetical protein
MAVEAASSVAAAPLSSPVEDDAPLENVLGESWRLLDSQPMAVAARAFPRARARANRNALRVSLVVMQAREAIPRPRRASQMTGADERG